MKDDFKKNNTSSFGAFVDAMEREEKKLKKSMKIVKSLDKDTSNEELESGVHSVNFCSWERLSDMMKVQSGLNIKGIRADERGIEFILK
jgi:hypothetical protein